MSSVAKRRPGAARNLRTRVKSVPPPHLRVVGAESVDLVHKEGRALAAILVAELPGYARLLRESKSEAKRARAQFRGLVADIADHNGGELVASHGGGVRCLFASAVLAVRAASEIQRATHGRTALGSVVALHIAEVVRTEDDVQGDGVTIVKRMLSLATPGEVLMSAGVATEIEKADGTSVRSLGRFLLKGTSEPLEVLVLDRVGGLKLEASDLWRNALLTKTKRRGIQLKTMAVLMGGATLFELASSFVPMPDWFVGGALMVVLVEWFSPLRGLRLG